MSNKKLKKKAKKEEIKNIRANKERDLEELDFLKKPEGEEKKAKDLVHEEMTKAKAIFESHHAYLNLDSKSFKSKIKIKCYHFSESDIFTRFFVFLIFWNTINMSLEHYNMSEFLIDFNHINNLIILFFFTWEMIIKLIAFGPKLYFSEFWNQFDASIVIVSLIEFCIEFANLNYAGFSKIGYILKSFRLFRAFKLAGSIESIQILMNAVASSGRKILYVTGIMLLFLYVFAVVGVQLFAQTSDDNPHRSKFRTTGWAFFTCFQVLTSDDWINVMAGTVGATKSRHHIFFFIILFLSGSYIIVSLFISILLENFTCQDDEQAAREKINCKIAQMMKGSLMDGEGSIWKNDQLAAKEKKLVEEIVIASARKRDEQKQLILKDSIMKDTPNHVGGKSLGIISQDNKYRQQFAKICNSALFDLFITLCIVISTIALILEKDGSDFSEAFFSRLDALFLSIFALEMAMKIFTFGLFLESEWTYLKNIWNVLDCLVVIFSVLAFLVPEMKIYRSFRAFRPLRIVVRNDDIKLVVEAFYGSLPSLFNVFLFCAIFWISFSILGVSLFSGKLYNCDHDNFTNKKDCENHEHNWLQHPQNFDDILIAFMTLFQCSTLSGWTGIAYDGIDASLVEHTPIENNNPHFSVLFILIILFCSFFSLNLFVGVFLDEFIQLKHRRTLLTPSESRRLATMELFQNVTLHQKDPIPLQKWKLPFYSLAHHKWFDRSIGLFIFLNTVQMCLVTHNDSSSKIFYLKLTGNLFLLIFVLEAIIKIIALTFKCYWKEQWNRFDFAIVVVSVCTNDMIAGSMVPGEFPIGAISSAFRTLRLFRLVKKVPALYRLINTLIISVVPLMNITLLLIVVFTVYAILAMDFCGGVEQTSGGLSRWANFDSFFISMLTLFRMATGDAWHEMLNGCVIKPPFCDYAKENCGTGTAYLFFLSFQILVGILLLNLFIAVVLENFAQTDQSVTKWLEIDRLAREWDRLDTKAEGVMSPEKFITIISKTRGAYGFGKMPYSKLEMFAFLRNSCKDDSGLNYEYWIPLHSVKIGKGKMKYFVKFTEMLGQLAKGVGNMGIDAKEYNIKGPECGCAHYMHHWYACKMLQDSYKRKREQKKNTCSITHNYYYNNELYDSYKGDDLEKKQRIEEEIKIKAGRKQERNENDVITGNTNSTISKGNKYNSNEGRVEYKGNDAMTGKTKKTNNIRNNIAKIGNNEGKPINLVTLSTCCSGRGQDSYKLHVDI